MNTLKIGPAGQPVSIPAAEDSLVVRRMQYASATLTQTGEAREDRTTAPSPLLQASAKTHPVRVAIKARGKICFISLGDVVSVQAKGKCVCLEGIGSSHLLRESISVLAKKLETHGFIRIHRSVLVNGLFVVELWPLSTGEYCLRLDGGKEYTVTRTYKANLRSLAQFWIGAGSFFPD
jgi:two-component system LytT family response regulator